MEEMINSFPPDFGLVKTALISKLKEVEQEYVPSWRSISWNVLDFEGRAIHYEGEMWKKIYDKSKFENALEKMISKHDAENGITWITVDFYLNEYCKI